MCFHIKPVIGGMLRWLVLMRTDVTLALTDIAFALTNI